MSERQRLDILRRYEILDTPTEDAFDDIVFIAAQIAGAPMAAISLIDDKRLWTKATHGFPHTQVARAQTFCGKAVEQNSVLVVPDATKDPRFADYPIVTGAGVKSYLGAPLMETNGYAIGTLCVMDVEPRHYSREQLEILSRLASQVIRLIEARAAEMAAHRLSETVATQNAVVLAVTQSESPEQAIRRCLQTMTTRSQWSAGRFLRVDSEVPGGLVATDIVSAREHSRLATVIDHRNRSPIASDGLAVRAMRSGWPIWMSHGSKSDVNDTVPNEQARTAMAVPLLVGPEVIGVFEYLSEHVIELNEESLATFTQVTTQIGLAFERQRAEDESFRQKEFLNAVLENLGDGVVACDSAGALTLFNNATREMHGLSESRLPPEKWAEYYSLYDADGTTLLTPEKVPLARAFRGEIIRDLEMVIAPSGQVPKRLVCNGRAMYDLSGRKLGAVLTMTDVTEAQRIQAANARLIADLEDARVGLEKRVAERTSAFVALNDSIPAIVWQADNDGRLLYMNARFEEYAGYTLDDSNWMNAFHADDFAGSEAAWRHARATGEPYRAQLRIRNRNGIYRWHLSRALPQRNEDGRIVKWLGTSTDIHETKETEAMLGNFFSLPSVMLSLVSREGMFTRVNSAWTETLGYHPSELTGRVWLDFIHPEDRGRVALQVGAAFPQKQTLESALNIEVRFRRRNGTYAWLNWTSVPREGVYYCLARDISASKDDELRLQSVFTSRMFGIFFWDAEGNISDANETYLDIIGYTREDLRGGRIDWTRMTPPEYAAADLQALREIQESGVSGTFEKEYIRKDGTRVHVLHGASSLFGTSQTGVGFIIDMTAQRATENRFEAIVHQSPFPTIVMNRNGNIIKVNDAWCELWDMPLEVVATAEFKDATIFDDEQLVANGVDDVIRRAMNGETVKMAPFLYVPKSAAGPSRPRWIESHFAPLSDAQGRDIEIIAVFNDVTDRVEGERERTHLQVREQAANEASKLKGEFLANMSHEIRTPINGVIGMTNLLSDTYLSDEQREYIHSIKSSADSLLTVINDILDFSKIESGKLEFDSVDFDLIELIDDIERSFTYVANAKKLRLVTDVKPDLPRHLKGDSGRLRQVFNNLVSNAIKFTPGGRIVLRGMNMGRSEDGHRLRFEVEDSGIGIPPAAMSRMFRAFSQADSSTTRRFGGTGLGLSISKHLVEYMHGDIGVNSVEGKGSTFWFEVVLGEGAVTAPRSRQQVINVANQLGRKSRILLVEDNVINQKIAMKVLDKMGLRCHAVGGGREALDALREFSYDLILMDCQMPDMDGYEATRIVRRSETLVNVRDIPIIAMTANALKGDREKCLAAGMNDYITKPVNVDELSTLLIRYLKSAAPRETDSHGAVNGFAKAAQAREVQAGFDPSVLAVLRALDGPDAEVSTAEEVIRLYLDVAPAHLIAIDRAFTDGNVAEVRAQAHSLKSASANIGAMAVSATCAELERIAATDVPAAAALQARLHADLERVYPELVKEFAPPATG